MFEVAGLFLIIFLVAGSAFFPLGCSFVWETTKKEQAQTAMAKKNFNALEAKNTPEDSVFGRHCLTHLQTEIESAFAPRPTDSVLQRHHDTLIAFELEKRLAELELTA